MSHALSSLEAFANTAKTMAKAAANQEWERLAQLQQERATLANSMPENLAAHLLPHEGSRAAELIETCRQLDAQILALLGERQIELRILLREPALG